MPIITGFIVGAVTDTVFDYNGTVQGAAGTHQSNATLAGGIAASATGQFIVSTDVANSGNNTQGSAFNDILNSTASNLATNFTELTTQLLATSGALNGTIAGLDAAITASEAALVTLDNGTGSITMRLSNTTATGNTIEAGELALIAVFTNAHTLVTADFA